MLCLIISAGVTYFDSNIFPNIRIVIEGNIHNDMLFSLVSVILAVFEVVVIIFGIVGCVLAFDMGKSEIDKWRNKK